MKTPTLTVLLCLFLASPVLAQDKNAAAAPKLSDSEVETLVGPVALYPDALIGIILPASTNAADIVLAARFLEKGGAIADVDKQFWDESVRALAHYPDVLKWMDENLEWTQQLGVTFLAQQEDVMAAIQRLRARAVALGNLPSTDQLTVVKQDNYIRIVPTVAETIYVPYYDPDIIYVSRFYWGFGPAWRCGPWLTFDCNWINRCIWIGSWSPRYFHRPAWHYVDRRPPPVQIRERHTWKPDPRRASVQPKPPPPGRPGTIARPRPNLDPRNPRHDQPPPPPSARPNPGQRQRPSNITEQRPGRENVANRPNPENPTTTPPRTNVNRPPSRQPNPPASTQPPAQRPPRNENVKRPATTPPPASAERPAHDGSRSRPSTYGRPASSANTSTGNTARQPSTTPLQRQTSQPAQTQDSSRSTPPPPPSRTTTRESSDSASSSSRSSSSSSSRSSSSSSSSSSSRDRDSAGSSSSSRSSGGSGGSSGGSDRSSYQPRQSSSRESSPPPAPRESRSVKPGAR